MRKAPRRNYLGGASLVVTSRYTQPMIRRNLTSKGKILNQPPPYPPQGPVSPTRQPKKSNLALGIILALVVLGIIGLLIKAKGAEQKADAEAAATSSFTPAPTAQRVPAAEYELVEDGRIVTMLVKTDDRAALKAAWQSMYFDFVKTHPEDGYFVYIDCALGPPGNRLGVGKIAIGKMGQARTGLGGPGATMKNFGEVDWNEGRTCG